MWGGLSKLNIFGAALVIFGLVPPADAAAESPHSAKHMLSGAMQCKLWGAQAASAYSVHEYGRAEQLYRQALSSADSPGITPDDRVLLMTNLGAAYREEGKYSEAATTLKQAMSFAEKLYSAYDPKLDYVSRQYDSCLQRQAQGLELPTELLLPAAQLPAPTMPIPNSSAQLPAPIPAAYGVLPPMPAGAPIQGWMPDGFDFYRYWGPDPESDRFFNAVWQPYEALNAPRPMPQPPAIADYGNYQNYSENSNFQNQSRIGIPIGYAVGRRFNPGYYSSGISQSGASHTMAGSAFSASVGHGGGFGGFSGGHGGCGHGGGGHH